jgi:hypothetical protein
MNKKGLSDVVTNVLIILLVVVAIGILWYFVSPLITKSGEKIQQGQQCLNLNLDAVICKVSGVDAIVNVKRGAGEANLKEVKLIFEKEDGSSESRTEIEVPGELETKVYNELTLSSNPKRVSVAGGVANEKGDVSYCAESAKVECK